MLWFADYIQAALTEHEELHVGEGDASDARDGRRDWNPFVEPALCGAMQISYFGLFNRIGTDADAEDDRDAIVPLYDGSHRLVNRLHIRRHVDAARQREKRRHHQHDMPHKIPYSVKMALTQAVESVPR